MVGLVLVGGGMTKAQSPAPSPESGERAPAGPVGGFELDDPVLDDEVMGGVIYKGQGWYLFPQGERTSVRGWLDGGFMGNSGNPGSKFNGPYNAVDRANEAMFNQAYLIAERVLPTDGSLGVGGRVDLLYGEDFLLAMSQGWEIQPGGGPGWNSGEYYGLAMPQLYAEFGLEGVQLPVRGALHRVGRFGFLEAHQEFRGDWRPGQRLERGGCQYQRRELFGPGQGSE